MRRPSKYPFADMQVGDTHFFADEPSGTRSLPAAAAHNFAYASKQRLNFQCEAINGGVQITRLEDKAPRAPSCGGTPVCSKYDFDTMKVGSVTFYADQPNGSQSNVALAARGYGTRNGKRFTTKAHKGGVQIKRIE